MAVYFNNTVPWYTDIIKEGGKAALTELIKGMFARDAAARTQRLDEAQWQKDWNNIQSQPDQMNMTIQSSPETMENAARAEGLLSGLYAAAADAENSSITPKTVFEDVKPITAPGYEGKTVSPDGNSITTDNNGILGLTYKANDYDLKNLDSRMAILNRLAKGNNGKAVSKANFKSLYDYIYGANQNDIKINEAQKRYDAVTSKYGPISSSNADPSSALVMMAMMGDKDAANLYQDQLSKENNTTFDTVDLGGRKVVLAKNPYTGKVVPVQSFGVTMTPQQLAEYKLKQAEEARRQQDYVESKNPLLSRPMAWLNSDDAKARFGEGYDPNNPTREQWETAIKMTARNEGDSKAMRSALDPRGEWAMQDRITEAGMIADALGKQGGVLTPEQRMAAGLAKDPGAVASTSVSATNKQEADLRREQFKAQSKEILETLRLDAEKGNHAAELAYKQYAADLDAITKKELAILRSETETGIVNTKARAELEELKVKFLQAIELEKTKQAGREKLQDRELATKVLITDKNNKRAFELTGLKQDTALRLAKINKEGRLHSDEMQQAVALAKIKAQSERQLVQIEHDNSKQASEQRHQLQLQANKAQHDSEALYSDFIFKSLLLQQKGDQDKNLEEYKAFQKQNENIARMQHEKDLLERQLNSQEGRDSAELQFKYASKKQELEEAQRNRDHARDQLVTQLAGAQILQEMRNGNSVLLAQMGIDSQQALANLRATVDREVLESQEQRHLDNINLELQKIAQSGKQFTEDQQRRKKEAENNLLLKQQQLENNYLKTHYGFLMDKYKADINVEMRRDIAALIAASRAQIASDKNASAERIAEGRNQTAKNVAATRAQGKGAGGSVGPRYVSSAEGNAKFSAISQARDTSEGIDSAKFALNSIPDPESRAAFSKTLLTSKSLIIYSEYFPNGTPKGDASPYTNPVYYETIAKDNGLSPDQADSFLNKAKIIVKDSANNPDLPADLFSAYIGLIDAYKKRKGNREQTPSAKTPLPFYGMMF